MSSAYLEVLQSYVSDLDEYDQHSRIQRLIQERHGAQLSKRPPNSLKVSRPIQMGVNRKGSFNGNLSPRPLLGATAPRLIRPSQSQNRTSPLQKSTGSFTSTTTNNNNNSSNNNKYFEAISTRPCAFNSVSTAMTRSVGPSSSSSSHTTHPMPPQETFSVTLENIANRESNSLRSKSFSRTRTITAPREDFFTILLEQTRNLWYLPQISREDTTELLTNADVGNFIIRHSSRGDTLALTLRSDGKCLHFSINSSQSGLSLSTSLHSFSTLPQLIAFYSTMGTDMSHTLCLPEFLFHCNSGQIAHFASMKADFWRRFQQIKQNVESSIQCARQENVLRRPEPNFLLPVETNLTSSLGCNRRSKSLTDLLAQQHLPGSLPSENVYANYEYDCVWHHAESGTTTNVSTSLKSEETAVSSEKMKGNENEKVCESEMIKESHNSMESTNCCTSVYDNYPSDSQPSPSSQAESTIYCQPWDQTSLSKAISQLRSVVQMRRPAENTSTPLAPPVLFEISEAHTEETISSSADEDMQTSVSPFVVTRQMSAVMSSSRRVGQDIRSFIRQLVNDEAGLFGKKISLFIRCTRESKKTDPRIVMSNVRQFLGGLRNYLLKPENTKLYEAIAKERPKLRAGEFLNVETVVECVLSRILIKPLKEHIYRLIRDDYERTNSMHLFSKAIDHAVKLSPFELGVRSNVSPPTSEQLQCIQQCFDRMVVAYSPLKKLEYLLKAVEILYSAIVPDSTMGDTQIGADDFLPIFVYCVCHCRLYAAELEAEFMQGLLSPTIINGEAGYYLTTLQASVEVIKALEDSGVESIAFSEDELSTGSMSTSSRRSSHCQRGVVRIIILDEVNDNIISKVFPLRPWSTVREICNMIAHRLNIYNPLDYSIYHYVNGTEKLLNAREHLMKFKDSYESSTGKPCIFLYKRTHSYTVMPQDFDGYI